MKYQDPEPIFTPNGNRDKSAKEFLRNVFSEYHKHLSQFAYEYHDYLHSYKERQQASALVPAFYKHAIAVLMEQPVRRKTRGVELDQHGWVDYWVEAYNRNVYLIEHKHSYLSLNTCFPNKDLLLNQKVMLGQLEKVDPGQFSEEYNLDTGYKNKSIYKIGLHTLYGYENAKDENSFQYADMGGLKECYEYLISDWQNYDLSPKQRKAFKQLKFDYSGFCYVKNPSVWDNVSGGKIYFPGVIMLVTIERV